MVCTKTMLIKKSLFQLEKYLKEKNTIFDTSFNYKNLDKIFKLFKNINSNYIIKISLNKKNENQLEKIFSDIKEKYKIKKNFMPYCYTIPIF